MHWQLSIIIWHTGISERDEAGQYTRQMSTDLAVLVVVSLFYVNVREIYICIYAKAILF